MDVLADEVLLGLLAFAVMAVSVGLWIRALRDVAVPANRGAFVASWAIGTALAIASLTIGDAGWLLRVPAWLAAAIGALLLLTVLISRQSVAAGGIGIGDHIPAFTAVDEKGAPFDSAALADHLVLIKFFRAHW